MAEGLTLADLQADLAECQKDYQAHKAEAVRYTELAQVHADEARQQEGAFKRIQAQMAKLAERAKASEAESTT